MWRSLAAVVLALRAVPAWSAERPSGADAVRSRLVEAAVVSADLFAKAEGRVHDPKTGDWAFPRASHIRRYARARPWALDFELRNVAPERTSPEAPAWPLPVDAAALREALAAPEPAVRALAAQALASLDEPEDVPRVAVLLHDAALAPPRLAESFLSLTLELTTEQDPLVRHLRWRNTSVKDYARIGLQYLTGRDLDQTSFDPWWERSKDAHACLWFWQQRFQHKMDAAASQARLHPPEASAGTTSQQGPVEPPSVASWREIEREVATRRETALREIAAELRGLAPEVEAKVRLLAVHEHSGGADITRPDETFFVGAPRLRVTPDRLLDLIDRKGLWADVDWDVGAYNRMVERLSLAANTLFTPRHVARLQAAYAREGRNLWWSGRAAMLIGRLLPAATVGRLDDVRARDGWLRAAVRHEDDVFVRGYVARELVRAALPANWPFLRGQFFREEDGSAIPDLRGCLLQALREPPLTDAKRGALMDLLLDEAFGRLWTRPSRRIGDDAHRQEAIASVNAHAGQELITYQEGRDLADEKRSAETLVRVLQKVRALDTARP